MKPALASVLKTPRVRNADDFGESKYRSAVADRYGADTNVIAILTGRLS
jgi:hypothetical protein